MKKIRILALLLAVLMIPFSLLVACKKDDSEEDECSVNGHEWNKKEVTIEKRTCTEPGIKERTCRVCKKVERYEWKPEGHTIAKSEWVYDDDATCTEDGHETRTCALCTYSETRVKKGTALGHSFINYAISEDGYSETAACDRCSAVTHTRIVGIKVDFEGERNTLSYDSFTVYTPEGLTEADYYKTEAGELNSYLYIERTDEIGIGEHSYGAIFAPGYSRLKSSSYVAEFDVKISKTATKDLVLLSGNKELASVDFLTYDADAHTISITYGPVYTLKESDFDRWIKLSVLLNDVERKYELYIDNKLVITDVEYQNDDYFAGMDLESFKITMTNEVGVPSSFAVDNIDVYIAFSPKGYEGELLDPDYDVYQTSHNNDKIMYKKLTDGCTHNLSTKSVLADCYNDGYSYKLCSVCNGQTDFTTDAAKLSHNMERLPGAEGYKAPTCTEYGAIYKKCSLCGYKDKEGEDKIPHVMDTTEDASYRNVPATCTDDGYRAGKCESCGCEMNEFNGEYKFGHNIVDTQVKVEANCIRDGYSEGRCINPGCGEIVRDKEIPAYGHNMKSEVKETDEGKVIESVCIRCNEEDAKTTVPLSVPGVFPNVDAMKTALGSNFYGGVDGAGFNSSVATNYNTGSGNVIMLFHDNGLGTSTAEKITEQQNTFLRFHHNTQMGNQAYFEMQEKFKKAGADIILEMSFRLPANGKFATGSMKLGYRRKSDNGYIAPPITLFKLDEKGCIILAPDGAAVNIGQLNSTEFSKISFVLHHSTVTFDAYFNGELKAQNVLMKKGEMDYVIPEWGVFYQNRFFFDSADGQKRTLDIDDMYIYNASVPVYITNPVLPDSAGTNYDVSKNKVNSDNEELYIPNNTSGVIGSGIQIYSNKNFRAYVEDAIGASGETVSALHCIKGNGVTNIPDAGTANASEIATAASIMNSTGAVLYNEIKFNAGSFTGDKMNDGKIILAQGRKDTGNGVKVQEFLYIEDGILYLGDGKVICVVEKDAWISYNVVINEVEGTYSVYVNGICRAERVKFASEYVSTKYNEIIYKPLIIDSGEFDFYIAGTALHAGATVPVSDVFFGEPEKVTVKTELPQKFEAIKFYENQSVSSYYNYVGKTVLSSDKLITLDDATAYANKDAVKLTKLDDKNVLETTNYKTNNLKWVEFKTLVNTRLAGTEPGVYDLSGYKYMSVRLNVKETSGYNVIFKLMTENGCYQIRVYLNKLGWQTVTLPLFENEAFPYFKSVGTTSGRMDDVVAFRIEFEGELAGNGNGKLMDGTTICFETVSFENETIVNEAYIGENLISKEDLCKNHSYREIEAVEPTCTSRGYKKVVCDVCGHIYAIEIKEPVKHATKTADRKEILQSCISDGIIVDHLVCSCGCEEDYYIITKCDPMKEHVIENGSCTAGCGKEEEASA